MAIMKVTRQLRDAPGGNVLGVEAEAGTKVKVLEEVPPWTKVQLITLPDKPIGFVSNTAVDKSGATALAALDKSEFADASVLQEDRYGISAHYLFAVSAIRSNVTDGPRPGGNGDTGPFALSAFEWKLLRTNPDLLLDFEEEDINFWRPQVSVFGAATYLTQNKLAGLLERQPTATELYFSQIVGTKAAANGIKNDAQSIDDLVQGGASDFQADGIEQARIISKSAGLLTTGSSVKVTVDSIATELEKRLDESQPFIEAIAQAIVADPGKALPDFASTTLKPGQSLFQAKSPPIMKQLIADFGLTDFQAAGVLGNIGHECGEFRHFQELKPLVPGSRGGFGWCQWTGPRRREFEKFCADNRVETTSNEGNYGYLKKELTPPHPESGIVPHLKAAASLEVATEVFMNRFLRPARATAGLVSRIKITKKALDAFKHSNALV